MRPKRGRPRQVFGAQTNSQSIRSLNRSDAIDSDHLLDASGLFRLSYGPWPRTPTIRLLFKFSCSSGSTATGTWPDFTSCRSNRRSSRIWRLCDGGVASGARGASASICTRLGQSLRSSSRNGSIARGVADTSSGPDGRRPASGCRHVPQMRRAASARRSSYRCIMPLGEPLLWRQDFDRNSEWVPRSHRNYCFEGISSWRRFTN
jgi:hypothetical protein